jgi:hypothetical protein
VELTMKIRQYKDARALQKAIKAVLRHQEKKRARRALRRAT